MHADNGNSNRNNSNNSNNSKFVINFEPDSILKFKNSNEQGFSFRSSEENKILSKSWNTGGYYSDPDSESEFTKNVSKKSKSKKRGSMNSGYDPNKDKQNVTFYKKKSLDVLKKEKKKTTTTTTTTTTTE